MKRHCLLALLLSLVLAGPGQAQPRTSRNALSDSLLPPGGWPLRRVTTLGPAPEPPGGLVPYRKGKRWGYADTTGRVWIAPVFQREPGFFKRSFARYETTRAQLGHEELYYMPTNPSTHRERRLQWRYDRQQVLEADEAKRQDTLLLLNARGEYLLTCWARPRRFSRAPDSSRAFTERPTSAAVYRNPGTPARFYFRLFLDPAGFVSWVDIGNRRFLAYRWKWWWPTTKLSIIDNWFKHRSFRHTRAALFTATGRRLTRYRFKQISQFRGGVALYQDRTDGSLGLLDTTGQRLTPPRFYVVCWAGERPTTYLVCETEDGPLNSLVDARGKHLIGPGPASLSLPDSAGFVRQVVLTPTSTAVRFLRLNGQSAFAGSFEQAGPFWRGRAEARQAGKYGLLDTTGRWVIPPLYDSIGYYPAYSRHGSPYEDRPYGRLDSAFCLMQVASPSKYESILPPDSVVRLRRGALRERRRALTGALVTLPTNAFRLYRGVGYFDGTTTWCQWATGATTRLGDSVRVQRHVYTPHGYRFVVTRTSDRRTAVVDSVGRRYSPWYRLGGYYGHFSDYHGNPVFLEHALICTARDSSYLLDATGRRLWVTANERVIPDKERQKTTHGMQILIDEGYRLYKPQDSLTLVYDRTGRAPAWPPLQSGVVAVLEGSVADTSWRRCILDQWGRRIVCGQFQWISEVREVPGWVQVNTSARGNHWLTSQGQPVWPPYRLAVHSELIPFNGHALWKTEKGYVTPAGRPLWAD